LLVEAERERPTVRDDEQVGGSHGPTIPRLARSVAFRLVR
jgi:hypothetical protein